MESGVNCNVTKKIAKFVRLIHSFVNLGHKRFGKTMVKKRIGSQEVDEALCAVESLDYTIITTGERYDYLHYLSYLSDTARNVARGVCTRHFNRVSA